MYRQWMHRMWLPICLFGWVLSMGSVSLAEPGGETPFAVPDAKMLQNAPESSATPEQMPAEPSSPVELNHLKSVVQMPPVPALSDPRTPLPEPPETGGNPVRSSTEEEELSLGSPGKIHIQSATYGGNCGVDPGNVTAYIADACNGKSKCTYTVDHNEIGDPAYGCKKTYVVTYKWGTDEQTYEQRLSAEAGWGNKAVVLTCPPDAKDRQEGRAGESQAAAGDMSGWEVSSAGFEATPEQISASPAADNKTSYYLAPDALLGDWSKITHILLEKKSSGGRYYQGSHGDIGDVVLDGPGGRAAFRLAEDHSGNWKSFRLPLKEGEWILSNGATSLVEVLKQVERFRIRAEYGYGTDTSALRGVAVVWDQTQ